MAGVREKAAFIEPMLLLAADSLPNSPDYIYEVKWDGYRALAIKNGGKIALRSRNNNDFNPRYPTIVEGLAKLPDETILDGEIVALDKTGRPSFNELQNVRSSDAFIFFYVFDVPMFSGKDLSNESLSTRRHILEQQIVPTLADPIRYSSDLSAPLPDLINAAKQQGLEGLVAKHRNSKYESGRRSGAWKKMRINKAQEFVIGGYTPAGNSSDAVIFGYYANGRLHYAARTRNGFTPASRLTFMKRFKGLEISECPFVNLPEKQSGRWGQGLTAAKMISCHWLSPQLVGQFEFVEWTSDGHLRHSSFVALRENSKPRDVFRE